MRLYFYKLLIIRSIEKKALYRERAFLYSAVGQYTSEVKYRKKAAVHDKRISKYLNIINDISRKIEEKKNNKY